MAASQDGKIFKQDMVVSIRYRNDLPPPPMPPKLLDIEHGGIAQYLTTGYAAGLVRRENPNVDADAEGGMPMDMVGVPGYFLGDESAIMAPEVAPPMDPADTALMLTIDQLRTKGAKNKGTSFLRKTQYMNSANANAVTDPSTLKAGRHRKSIDKSNVPVARDDPENIKRHIQKGFDLAYPDTVAFSEGRGEAPSAAERHAWNHPTHPDNPNLKPVGFYPVMPDLGAVTDGGGKWSYIKFSKPPLPAHHDRRDDRIDAGFLAAVHNRKEHKTWQARKDAFDKDPQRYEDPGPEPYIWSLHVPKSHSSTSKIRKLFNDSDPSKDRQDWLNELSEQDGEGQMRIPFIRARAYPSVKQDFVDPRRLMALSFHDPTTAQSNSRLRKQGPAAYYYPIMERQTFKAEGGQSGSGLKPTQSASQIDDHDDITRDLPDELMLLPLSEVSALQRYGRHAFRGEYDKSFAPKWEDMKAEAIAERSANEAETIVDEQGSLHKGAQDVSMAEVEAADDMDVAGNGDGGDRDGDQDMDDDDDGSD